MVYDNLLEKSGVTDFSNPQFFNLQKKYFELFGKQTGASWQNKESYRVSVDADENFPECRYSYTSTLKGSILDSVSIRFDCLEKSLRRYLSSIGDDGAKRNFFIIIINQLREILDNSHFIDCPEEYSKAIQNSISERIKILKREFHFDGTVKIKKTWKLKYARDFKNDDGRFRDFFRRLKYEGLLSETTTLTTFKQFFSDEIPKKPILWEGKIKAELITLIAALTEKEYIEPCYRPYSAFSKCFQTTFPMNNLSSETPLTEGKDKERIQNIVDELDI